ncbi:MAG: hypothetical protein ACE5RJ_02455 [Nitrosopumilaceae archaeon]
MTASPSFCEKTVDVDNRLFLVQVLNYDNGNFISISEGGKKLGSMMVSLSTGPTPVTTTVIPSKTESFFLKLTAEKISTITKGITIVSTFVQKELNPNTAKTLINEIAERVRNV